MKKFKSVCIICLIAILIVFSCNNETPQLDKHFGTIKGVAIYGNRETSAGITITVESIYSDGLSSSGVAATTHTNADGSYFVENLSPGEYTVYASSSSSKEKALSTNVKVLEGQTVTVPVLNLTQTGTIKGQIAIDDKVSGLEGFTVYIAGTSYSSITSNDGSFSINDVPFGQYAIMIMKNNGSEFLCICDLSSSECYDIGEIFRPVRMT